MIEQALSCGSATLCVSCACFLSTRGGAARGSPELGTSLELGSGHGARVTPLYGSVFESQSEIGGNGETFLKTA